MHGDCFACKFQVLGCEINCASFLSHTTFFLLLLFLLFPHSKPCLPVLLAQLQSLFSLSFFFLFDFQRTLSNLCHTTPLFSVIRNLLFLFDYHLRSNAFLSVSQREYKTPFPPPSLAEQLLTSWGTDNNPSVPNTRWLHSIFPPRTSIMLILLRTHHCLLILGLSKY